MELHKIGSSEIFINFVNIIKFVMVNIFMQESISARSRYQIIETNSTGNAHFSI
jgi:hypothetical protein